MDFFSGNLFSMADIFPEYLKTIRHVPLYYGIQYNHAGGIYVKLNDGPRYEEHGPCVLVTYPGSLFEYGPLDNQPRDHRFVCFHGPRIARYIASGLLPLAAEHPLIKIHYPDQFYHTITELITMINGLEINPDRTVLKLEDLLLQLHEQSGGIPYLPPFQFPHFVELLKEINNRPNLDWNFRQEAEQLNVTPTHFRRLFKRCCHISPQQYLIHHRLRLAAQLLVTTRLQVGIIAEKVGFSSEFYFSRLFKKKYHLSPLQYRKEFIGIM